MADWKMKSLAFLLLAISTEFCQGQISTLKNYAQDGRSQDWKPKYRALESKDCKEGTYFNESLGICGPCHASCKTCSVSSK